MSQTTKNVPIQTLISISILFFCTHELLLKKRKVKYHINHIIMTNVEGCAHVITVVCRFIRGHTAHDGAVDAGGVIIIYAAALHWLLVALLSCQALPSVVLKDLRSHLLLQLHIHECTSRQLHTIGHMVTCTSSQCALIPIIWRFFSGTRVKENGLILVYVEVENKDSTNSDAIKLN